MDPSGKFAFIPLLLVGLAGGALGGLGYYGIQSYMHPDPCTGRMNWDWNQAAFWSGAGAALGAAIGAGIYGGWWVGVQAGWWGQTTAAVATGSGTYAASRLYSTVEVVQSKLNYLLSNRGKAVGFERLGYTSQNSGALGDLLTSVGRQVTDADMSAATQYGTIFEKIVEVTGSSGATGRLTTIWQINEGTEILRLITGWVEVYK